MTTKRFALLDWLRGFAILLMVIYHFCYDLYYFDYIDTAFGKGYWVPFRYVIVILFLTLVGVSLVMAHGKSIRWSNLKKRSLQLGSAAVFVTLSSYFVAANKITVFGILHFILLASFLALPLLKSPKLALGLGIVIFSLGHIVQSPIFDPNYLHWIGMVENKRPALDYVPVFPWFGVVLIGVFLGHLIMTNKTAQIIANQDFSQNKHIRPIGMLHSTLCFSGRHSLVIYLLHQPVLFGAFMAFNYVVN